MGEVGEDGDGISCGGPGPGCGFLPRGAISQRGGWESLSSLANFTHISEAEDSHSNLVL